jgi:hypothetical protein
MCIWRKAEGATSTFLDIFVNFTKCAQAYPTRNMSGETAAKKSFWMIFSTKFGFVSKIHHNQGRSVIQSLA